MVAYSIHRGQDFDHLGLKRMLCAGLIILQQSLGQNLAGKVREPTPLEKLLDAFINILASGQGMIQVNTRVRPDEGSQRAFGRKGCADQSVISQTLNQCHEETVEQLRQAMSEIVHRHGQSIRHDYSKQCLLLDVDHAAG